MEQLSHTSMPMIVLSDRTAMGSIHPAQAKKTDHAILVVGYGTENGVDFWLIKNSWGTTWGNAGQMKIRRGRNECGIGSYCYTAYCEKNYWPTF